MTFANFFKNFRFSKISKVTLLGTRWYAAANLSLLFLYVTFLLVAIIFSSTEGTADCKSSILDLQIQLSSNVYFINLVSDNISSLLQSYPEQFPQQLKALIQLNTEIKVYKDQVDGILDSIDATGVYKPEQAEVFKNIIRVLEEYLRSPFSDPKFAPLIQQLHCGFLDMVEFNKCLIVKPWFSGLTKFIIFVLVVNTYLAVVSYRNNS